MIDLPRIRAFLAAAECLNFTEASKRLYLTQSALSKQIASIEDDLGFKLFVRSNKNVSLTPQGAYLYKRMRESIDELDSSVVLARTIERGSGGSLKVACLDTLSKNPVVKQVFGDFIKACPGLALDISFLSFRALREQLIGDRVDVIITKEFEVSSILGEDHYVLFESPPVALIENTSPLAGRNQVRLNELRDCEFISISPAESLGAHNMLMSSSRKGEFVANVARYVSDYKSLLFYLEIEGLVAIADMCDHERYRDDLIRAIPIEDLEPHATVAAWKKENRNPSLTVFRELIVE